MDKFIIYGGNALRGSVTISGSKNAALPILCSSILADGLCTFNNVPRLMDIKTICEVLAQLGIKADKPAQNTVVLDPTGITSYEAPYDLVKSMRASILVLGPLLAKYGKAKVSLPGGCAIGVRPIDLHLKAFAKMGAEIELSHGYVIANTKKLKGTRIVFDSTTVGGTENVMMAACLADGTTVIEGAAREPEVVDLAEALNAMGARIEGVGESTMVIEGVKSLSGLNYDIIPDRIELATFLVAAAITKGKLTIKGGRAGHVSAVIDKLMEMGIQIEERSGGNIQVNGDCDLKPVDVQTVPYPGFPTDMQAQIMSLACIADGASSITENIFENRFMHVPELMRM